MHQQDDYRALQVLCPIWKYDFHDGSLDGGDGDAAFYRLDLDALYPFVVLI